MPVPPGNVPPMDETPELIRQEARKMYLFIKLWQIAGECTNNDGSFLGEQFFERRFEVKQMVDELLGLWPDLPIMGMRYPPPGRTSLMMFDQDVGETVIWYPDIYRLFNDILSRVRLKVARDKSMFGKSPFFFNIKNGSMEIKESCLLARLWYEMISDMIKGVTPPRLCYCGILFFPDRPNQDYCSPDCQEAAKKHRQRARNATKDGRELRPTRGRPPKIIL